MNFMILDMILLVLFASFIFLFLYKNRKKLKKEGWLFLYHTKWGVKLIEKTGNKYTKTLKVLSHFSIWIGYVLMAMMIYLFGRIVWIYTCHSDVVSAIKIPPIMPLIPYLPQMFKLSFLPPFYFSYWILILAIIAITHEFFHGIFASSAKIKTKTTGFGFFPFFFPIFLAAFVNLDEKAMEKRKNFKQRAVLSAGTFANILTAILGVFLMWGFFSVAYAPEGIMFDDYAYDLVNIKDIESINGMNINWNNISLSEFNNFTDFTSIIANDKNYFAVKALVDENRIALYYDAPAIKENITGVITKINGEQIEDLEKLSLEMEKYSPTEKIVLEIFDGQDYYDKNIVLGKNPFTNKSWIGISFYDRTSSSLLAKISSVSNLYKKPNVYYLPKWQAAEFIYDFLWWLVLISFSVALVNMLPMGIFDGGRFFYLTVLAITKSEKKAEKSFKILTNIFLILLAVVMIFWAKSFF
jgi:membrane-associated protease RseP (regulator of RpoE activity)